MVVVLNVPKSVKDLFDKNQKIVDIQIHKVFFLEDRKVEAQEKIQDDMIFFMFLQDYYYIDIDRKAVKNVENIEIVNKVVVLKILYNQNVKIVKVIGYVKT